MRSAGFRALAVLVFVAGCTDDVQFAAPPAQSGATGEMPAGHPTIGGAASRPIATHGTDVGASRADAADPFAEADTGAPKVDTSGGLPPDTVVLAGEIAVDPAIKLPDTFSVYVSALEDPRVRMPSVVRRYDGVKFPFKFELRVRDSMSGQTSFTKPLILRASISPSGDAFDKRHQTLSGAPFPPMSKDATLTLKP